MGVWITLAVALAASLLVVPAEASLVMPRVGLINNSLYDRAMRDINASMSLLGVEAVYVTGTTSEIREYARLGMINLAFTPSHIFACLSAETSAAPISSIVRHHKTVDVSQAGGVIFTKHDRSDIASLADIEGKVISAVGRDSLFGYAAQRHEILRHGIEILTANPQIIFTADQYQVVLDVVNGLADVGFVQTGIIEEMMDLGLVFVSNIKFLNEYNHFNALGEAYPFRSSTNLYSDWVLSSITGLSEEAGASSISYWRSPLSTVRVFALLRELSFLTTNADKTLTCGNMDADLEHMSCPYGFRLRDDFSCDTHHQYPCPTSETVQYQCVCYPCVSVCAAHETYSDGNCECDSGYVTSAGTCVPFGILIVQVLVPVIIVIASLILYNNHRQRLKTDGIWQIDAKDLVLDQPPEVLGSGSFGVVLAAKLRGQAVAVKRAYVNKHRKQHSQSRVASGRDVAVASSSLNFSLSSRKTTTKRTDHTARNRMRTFFIEAEAAVNKASANNASSSKPSRTIHDTEYMQMGSLYNMLHNEAMELDDEFRYNSLHNITCGMRHLHNADLIHGDLKALNCLVDSKFQVKVSDFGMAGFASEHSQRGGTLAWMAPELLRGGPCTFASDVYSFGMVMFEVFSREDPYEDMSFDSNTLVQNILGRKLRPVTPENMPPELAVLMNEAFAADPDMRPTFVELLRRIEPLEGKMRANSRKGGIQDNELLEQVFPKHIAAALREGRTVEPEHHAEVTIFFSDICGFTDMSATLEPVQVSNMLDRLYTVFDQLCDKHGLYKIETIGDAYMCVGNLFVPQPDHAARVARFAMDALAGANAIPIIEDEPEGDHINIRVGFHSGPVVSNVVGTLTPRFCLFGSTVNCASRMESNSVRNCIHMSPEAAALVQKHDQSLHVIQRDPVVNIKGLGKMQTYWLGHAPGMDDVEATVKMPRKARFSTVSNQSARSPRVSLNPRHPHEHSAGGHPSSPRTDQANRLSLPHNGVVFEHSDTVPVSLSSMAEISQSKSSLLSDSVEMAGNTRANNTQPSGSEQHNNHLQDQAPSKPVDTIVQILSDAPDSDGSAMTFA
ncbi:uncharacterized protein MONBRDRAFT_29467 [Monosiga brevicollis MX1]|uniref:guanylate cyclase n=1 Tax=Monosiga brevicollis TaxID=81824 RepID=A9VB65_MONBE|nr:uncharacterized protein MONBRDRAFT_29467 [Monosiga brevicollis MX1]EDQ85184.1 predicted protein [Monosiga brevicollis MX1]|eukprot:XP_001750009.1 hypothetical protein [Monosiga brevicollis MX1]